MFQKILKGRVLDRKFNFSLFFVPLIFDLIDDKILD